MTNSMRRCARHASSRFITRPDAGPSRSNFARFFPLPMRQWATLAVVDNDLHSVASVTLARRRALISALVADACLCPRKPVANCVLNTGILLRRQLRRSGNSAILAVRGDELHSVTEMRSYEKDRFSLLRTLVEVAHVGCELRERCLAAID